MKTLFRRIFDGFGRKRVDQEFIDQVRGALSDGFLTNEERLWLANQKDALGASDDWRQAAPELFAAAARGAIKFKELSVEDEAQLDAIRQYLQLEVGVATEAEQIILKARDRRLAREEKDARDAKAALQRAEVARQRMDLLARMRRADVPPIPVVNVPIRKGEKALFEVPGRVLEQKVIRRDYVSGSRGTSIRIMRGVSFRVGASRGHSVAVEGIVPVSIGRLIITTKRFIFSGAPKSWSDPIVKLIDIVPYSNGLKYSVEGKTTSRTVEFTTKVDTELFVAAIEGAASKAGSD